MKDRPPSSCCAVYIPPHHRFRSVVFSPNSSNSSKNGADFPTSAASVIHSKLLDRQNIPVLNAKGTAAPPPLSYLQHDEKQQQRQRTYNSNNGNKNSNNQSSQYNSAYCHGISKNGSDRQMDLSLQSGTFGEANVDEWKRKLVILLHDDGKQELVSREKKDRRYFEQIAALASRMGLYSHLYSKVAVFSKAPLPNYRFDLDDKRPQREVNLNFGLLKRVDAHLGEYLSKKSRTKESFSDNCFSKSSSNSSIVTDEGLFEQPEPMASNTAIMEKILWRRSLQLHAQQQAWQESLEGRGILEFRQSLPAYKEKDAILTAILQNQGFTHPVRIHFLENILEMMGYRLTPYNQIDDYGQERMWKMSKQAPRKRKSQIASAVEDALRAADFKDFSPQTWESLSCWNPDCIGFNLIEYLLSYICENERPGAVLVFVTGWDDISSLKDKLQSHPILGDPNRVSLLTCHGFLASSEQKLIFEEPKDGVRKIVLTTNIAETSITINDVVFVLDCGKAKETSYDALNNTPCLLPSWISKVSAQQRRGRAGRVEPGECYHLYPRCVYDAFAEYQLPEILRTPLQSLCLQIKSLKLESISEFLSRALQSPELLAVQNAVEYLKIIGALDESENLTILGRYLTMLPMEPKLGKMLILGAILNCLDPVLTVVAGLSVRDPFLTPLDKKDLAETAKLQFSRDYSDHLALVRAYEGWKEAEKDLAGYDYCWKNFLSAQSMKAIDSLRVEFLSLLKGTGLIDGNATSCNTWSYDQHLIRAIICYGLYPGICSVVPHVQHNEKSFSLKTMEDGPVLLYSNSVNARESRIPYPWLVFNEKIKVNSIFLRDSTAVSDSVLLLFGGSISRGNVDGHLKMLGGYLEFFMQPAIAEKFQSLRREFDELIQNKLLNPQMVLHFHHELISAVRLLVSEDQCDGRFVFGRQDLKPSTMPVMPPQPTLVSRTESGPGGDNSKSQLQTLLTRAGYAAPTYKTKQLKNNQFRATVEFNGMQIMGQPWNNKKSAEKDAAAEALKWLIGGTKTGHDYFNHMSMLLKKSKRDH
ncbi:DExH-box ATP-dependent RNA helicase DExH5, mitochondrial isoform X5 [Durio zibethinus]|uniref:RNA helicase n=1 Tax=Durio zibethinus TaxID=66656 RepID=A0A6P6BFR5_DURZI|nr:DExH-box ATP-dependent RNA helicase DExH5, mitochondrial isoform X5 [Durio zibethinus]